VITFKRGVYVSALRHLAPFARQVAGPLAVPVPAHDPRLPPSRNRQRPRSRPVEPIGRSNEGEPGQN